MTLRFDSPNHNTFPVLPLRFDGPDHNTFPVMTLRFDGTDHNTFPVMTLEFDGSDRNTMTVQTRIVSGPKMQSGRFWRAKSTLLSPTFEALWYTPIMVKGYDHRRDLVE